MCRVWDIASSDPAENRQLVHVAWVPCKYPFTFLGLYEYYWGYRRICRISRINSFAKGSPDV
jgi:hypothetical protein